MEALPAAPDPSKRRMRGLPPRARRFLFALAAAGCVVGIGWGFSLSRPGEAALPKEVESVSPAPGSPVVPGQSPIEVDLLANYDGALSIDGHEIPADQVIATRAVGLLVFRPGNGQEYKVLPGGTHTASVTYWPASGRRERDGQVFTWAFTVL